MAGMVDCTDAEEKSRAKTAACIDHWWMLHNNSCIKGLLQSERNQYYPTNAASLLSNGPDRKRYFPPMPSWFSTPVF
jgi:hypothetical protein